jgi:hypothetical protein
MLLVLFFYHACSVEIILEGSVEIILEGSVEIIFVCWYVVQSNLESEARSVTSIVINLEYLKKQRFPEIVDSGIIPVLADFEVSGIWPFSRIPGEGPSSGQIRPGAGSWPGPGNLGFPGSRFGRFRGPDLAGFGVRNPGKKHTFRDDGFSCIQQYGPGFW